MKLQFPKVLFASVHNGSAIKIVKKGLGFSSMAQYLLGKHEVLSSIPTTLK